MTENTSIREPGTDAVEADLLDFLSSRTGLPWSADDDVFASGAVSSLFALELVVHLENEFGVTIGGQDLVMDNFRTVRVMRALVERLREAAPDA